MKVAIDITSLKTNHKYRGVGFYTKNLILALKKYQPKNKYIFFTRGENLPQNVDLIHYPHLDLFHCTLPLFKKWPTVVTIHDLIPIIFPNKFPRGIRGEIRWQLQRFSLKSVTAIITDSETSKKDIIKFTGFSKERIYVIPLAPGREFKKLDRKEIKKLKIREKYKLPRKYILYVGDVNWNKNTKGLIRAFKKLKMKKFASHISYKPEKVKMAVKNLKLVLVGKAFLDKELKEIKEINALISRLKLETQILKLGFVPIQDLVAIYNLATVYCQPSFYEGFGLPCLEAMACGTPVVASDISVLRETCGEAAINVNPYNPSSIASGLIGALNLAGLGHLALVKKGLEQARRFSWKKVAGKTVEVYKEAVGKFIQPYVWLYKKKW